MNKQTKRTFAPEFRLEDAGFITGTPLKIRVMRGCLVLTAQEPLPAPPAEPEIMQTLKTVIKLSGRKQQQILEFIGGDFS